MPPRRAPGDVLKDIKGQNDVMGWCHCRSEQVIITRVLANYIDLCLIGVSYLMTP